MKRFTGWLLVIAGGIGTAWGAVSVMTGSSSARVDITSTLSVTALTVGLAALAVLTVGLIWVRD